MYSLRLAEVFNRLLILAPRPIYRHLYGRIYGLITIFLGALLASVLLSSLPSPAPQVIQSPDFPNTQVQSYDAIVFGDEIPGVMTALHLSHQIPKGKIALVTEADLSKGLGGHLVRGGLAYLDRNQVPLDVRRRLGIDRFAPSSELYAEFLKITETKEIALDRYRASKVLSQALQRAKIKVIDKVQVLSVQTNATQVQSFLTAKHGIFAAKYFVDCTQGGKLATMAGVRFYQGFDSLGLPNSSLALGLMIEIYGLNIKQLRDLESRMIQRFLDPKDAEAQKWLEVATGGDPALRQAIFNSWMSNNKILPLHQGTVDSADVRSSALGAAFHGMNGMAYDLRKAKMLLDRANVAIFADHLSMNSLLFYADGKTSRELSFNGGKPSLEMLNVANKVANFYKSLGAKEVRVMDELYIRSAGSIAKSMDDLTATKMAGGGVSASEALGTFTYHLDVRGGITGMGSRAFKLGIKKLNLHLHMPTFNYGFRHTLPVERDNLAVLSPASGFGGLGIAAGRIVEFNISVGEGLAIAVAKALREERSLHSISNHEVRQSLSAPPLVYGRPSPNYDNIKYIETVLQENSQPPPPKG
ncbi:MAG: FAD-dependent oxidoreductase [Coleofasciculaceae cyanobacterium SM2_1_6]|nr:FAD-dependent oxidoreductase [Coleofasciculaceae cyanobacterium SM2_1_6]